MLLLFGIEEKRGWLPLTGMSGGGGGFGVDDVDDDEVNEEWTKLELGTGKPGLGEAPTQKSNQICIDEFTLQSLKFNNGKKNRSGFFFESSVERTACCG